MSDKEWEIFKEKVQPIKASGKVKYTKKKTAAKSVQERKVINEINLHFFFRLNFPLLKNFR